jgi:L-ribulokinase
MAAATAAGVHARVEDAQRAMGAGTEQVYSPRRAAAARHDARYRAYLRLGAFVESELTGTGAGT